MNPSSFMACAPLLGHFRVKKKLRESAGMSNEVLCYSIIILAVVALAGNGKHND